MQTAGQTTLARAAARPLTNALRQELAPQGTRVAALHVGYTDTDMARGVDAAKANPTDPADPANPADIARVALDGIARTALDGIEAGQVEIVADDVSRRVLGGLSGGVPALSPQVA